MLTLKIVRISDICFYWMLYGKNGKSICKSVKEFKTERAAQVSADNFERNALRFDVRKNFIS